MYAITNVLKHLTTLEWVLTTPHGKDNMTNWEIFKLNLYVRALNIATKVLGKKIAHKLFGVMTAEEFLEEIKKTPNK